MPQRVSVFDYHLGSFTMKRLARSFHLGFLVASLVLAVGVSAWSQEKEPKTKQPPTAKAKVAAPKVPDSVVYERDVQYGAAGDRALKLDVIRPRAESKSPRPVVVWIHGGGWSGGDKSSGLGLLMSYALRGDYVCFSVGYRLSGEAKWPAQIHDCKAAIRWIKANAEKYNIDPQRIGVWGSSAGGHLVSLLGTSGDVKELEGNNGSPDRSSRVACVVDFCGPSDLPNFFKAKNDGGARRPIVGLLGGTVEEKAAEAVAASPVTYVTKDDAPILIVHGTEDFLVPIAQAETLYDAARKAGVEATFIKMDGGGHGIGGPEIARRVTAFFDKQLLGKKADVSVEPIKVEPPKKAVKSKETNTSQEKERIEATELQMKVVSFGVLAFHARHRTPPTALDDLIRDPGGLKKVWYRVLDSDEIPKDAWGRAFRYELKKESFTLSSFGPDGRAGTVDDIVLTREF
jgi:acetyl esterase/lipase